MPYAPGVEDRSGEIRAAGMARMGSSLGSAIGDAMQEYRQNKMRNAVLEGENSMLLQALQKDESLKQYVPDAATLDKLIEKKNTGGGLTLKDNMKLNAMLNTGLKVGKHVGDVANQRMQQQAAAMQVQGLMQGQMRQMRDDEATAKALDEINSIRSSGRTVGASDTMGIFEKHGVSQEARYKQAQIIKALEPDAPKQPSQGEALYIAKRNAMESQLGRNITAKEEAAIRTEVATINRPTTTIKTGDDVVARDIYASLKDERATATAAMRALPAYDEAEKILGDGNVITGGGANARLAVAKVMGLFGGDAKDAENTEVLRAQIAIPVLSLVKNLGSGSGISNKDLEFAERAAGGSIALEAGAIKRLIEIGRKASKNSIDGYESRLNRTYPQDGEYKEARNSLMLDRQSNQTGGSSGFRTGQRVMQDGKLYQYDGAEWSEVK